MTPTKMNSIEEVIAYADSYQKVWGGDDRDRAAIIAAVAEENGIPVPDELKAKHACGCGHHTKVMQSEMWTKAGIGKLVNDELLGSWMKTVDKVLGKQVDAVVKEIQSASTVDGALVEKVLKVLDKAEWNPYLVEALSPFIRGSIEHGIDLGMNTLGKMVGSRAIVAELGWKPKEMMAYVERATTRLSNKAADGVNSYTEVAVKSLLGIGMEMGEDTGMLTKRVQAWAASEGDEERGTRARARMIARTEAARAAATSELDAWKSTGLVTGKTWLLAPDPCEFCEAAANMYGEKSVGIGDSFFPMGSELVGADGGTMVLDYEDVGAPPLHPHCRCALMPQLVDNLQSHLDSARARLQANEAKGTTE